MAATTYGVNDAATVKVWSKRLDAEVLKETYFARFMGESDNSLAQVQTELNKGSGDRVRYFLRQLFTQRGRTENQVLENYEESLSTYYDELFIGDLRAGARARSEITIDLQRVDFNLRQINYDQLKDWMADRLDTWFFNQLAGYTAQTDLAYTGMNLPLAPSANRVIRAGAQANDQSLTSSDKMTLNLIDRCRTRARRATNSIRPIRVGGKNMYVMFIAPEQEYDLRADVATVGNWFDLMSKRLQGGEGDDNGIFTGALGVYNNTIIHTADRIPTGVHSSTGAAVANTRRAVFCGAQALTVAFGKRYGKNKFDWQEETFDYNNELGVATRVVGGMKKTVYNSEDYGVITVPTYAAAV